MSSRPILVAASPAGTNAHTPLVPQHTDKLPITNIIAE